jgi:hypothetical protein
MRALLRQVAHDHLGLGQVDHERLGSFATGLAGLSEVPHFGRGRFLAADVDTAGTMVSPSSTCA